MPHGATQRWTVPVFKFRIKEDFDTVVGHCAYVNEYYCVQCNYGLPRIELKHGAITVEFVQSIFLKSKYSRLSIIRNV